MNKSAITLAFSLLISVVLPPTAQAQSAITEQEAHSIGVNAYLYFYSLLSMDVTRKQFTNIEPGKELGKGPMNMFVNVPEYPPADFKGVVRSNFDTLYSIAWLDMSKEPVVINAPDTNGRYYLLPMLDMWTDVFASPGWRTTGTKAGTFLVTPPGWRPDLREYGGMQGNKVILLRAGVTTQSDATTMNSTPVLVPTQQQTNISGNVGMAPVSATATTTGMAYIPASGSTSVSSTQPTIPIVVDWLANPKIPAAGRIIVIETATPTSLTYHLE